MNDESALEGNEKLGATAGVAGVEASGAKGSAPADAAAVLRAAADLIEPEGAWTQRANARGRSGKEVAVTGKYAVSFCAYGAVQRVTGLSARRDDLRSAAERALWTHVRTTAGSLVSTWNDTPGRTQAEVVAALRKAADLADGVPAARPLADASQVPGIIE